MTERSKIEMPRLPPVLRLAALLSLFVLNPGTAYAYIDPGTGSIVLQAIAGGVIAVSIFWRRVVERVKRLFRSRTD